MTEVKIPATKTFRNIKGNRYGRLLVVYYVGNNEWHCQCDCGVTVELRGRSLWSGHSKSCGCVRKEKLANFKRTHNRARTSEYYTWISMKQRCCNPRDKGYKDYGARGITVCDRWMESFSNFLADMGERPAGLSLDRKNNDLGYFKENCQWATAQEQTNNRRPRSCYRLPTTKKKDRKITA